MKAKTIAMALMLYGSIYAQTGMKKDSDSFLESIGKKAYETIENVVNTGVDYAEKKFYEAKLEDQIEQRISYNVEDKETRNLLNYLGLKQETKAYITKSDSNNVAAKVYFGYGLDDLAFAQVYEFSLKDGSIDKIVSKGNRWIDIKDKGRSWNDGIKALHLYNKVIMDWENEKGDYENKNSGEKFVYSRKSIDVNGNSATSTFEYHVLDKYGNIKNNKEQNTAIEYKFSDGKWVYYDTNFFSSEKNPKKEKTGILKEAFDGAKKGMSKLKDVLWGD